MKRSQRIRKIKIKPVKPNPRPGTVVRKRSGARRIKISRYK